MCRELFRRERTSGSCAGQLAELPAFADTRLIAPACHDTASAIAAIPDAGDDWAYISSGTWSLVGTLLERAREYRGGAGGELHQPAGRGGNASVSTKT